MVKFMPFKVMRSAQPYFQRNTQNLQNINSASGKAELFIYLKLNGLRLKKITVAEIFVPPAPFQQDFLT